MHDHEEWAALLAETQAKADALRQDSSASSEESVESEDSIEGKRAHRRQVRDA